VREGFGPRFTPIRMARVISPEGLRGGTGVNVAPLLRLHPRSHRARCHAQAFSYIPAAPNPCSTRCANFSWRAATSRIVRSASVSYMVSARAKIS
jgi:hypothetical protein